MWARVIVFSVAAASLGVGAAVAQGDADAGAQAYRMCAACHALEPGRHLTGPSLAGIWGRKAGTIEDFRRYSPALAESGLVWNRATLDAWLTDPQALVPGNHMTFPGIDDAKVRADLTAFLEGAGGDGAEQAAGGGMMSAPTLPDLKAAGPDQQVATIGYCGDTYRVTTAAGETLAFWEFNLRFKTDSSDHGPPAGRPALLAASMMGDRAFVIFADPAEISATITKTC